MTIFLLFIALTIHTNTQQMKKNCFASFLRRQEFPVSTLTHHSLDYSINKTPDMKNSTRFSEHNKKVVSHFITFKIAIAFVLLVSIFNVGYSQNAIVGSGFSSGWGSGCNSNSNFTYFSAGAGTSYTSGALTPNGTGNQYWRLGVDWGGTQGQYNDGGSSDQNVSANTTYSLNMSCTGSGAMYYNVGSTSYRYVFKTANAGSSPTGTWVFFEIQGTVQSISSQSISPSTVYTSQSPTVTATLSGSLSVGQGVYLRYTTNSWSTSSVIQLIGSGTSYSASIPSQTSGTTVIYYLFTSGTSNVASNGSNADLYTINLLNNGGSNYTYTVQTPTAPTVTSSTATSITNTSAVLGANVTSAGTPSTLTAVGTVYSTTSGVTISNNPSASGSTSTGVFTMTRSSLSPQTLYYYAGYATNSASSSGLSTQGTFYTLSNPPTAQASGLSTSSPSTSSLNISLSTAATYPSSGATKSGYLLIYSSGTPALVSSPNGLAPYSAISTGTQVAISDASAPSAPTLPTSVTGLTPTSTYNFLLVPYTWDGTNTATYNYLTTSAATCSGTTLTAPAITVGSLTAFGSLCVNSTSSPNSFTVSGTNLTANIVLTPPSGYQISQSSGSGYTTGTISLTPSGGTVSTTTIYVEFIPTAATSYTGNITATSTGATSQNLSTSGTGVALPTLTGTSSSGTTLCTGSSATISLSGLTASSTFNISYTVGGTSGTQTASSVTSNGSGAASFSTIALTTANSGQTITVTSIYNTSTTCTFTPSSSNTATLPTVQAASVGGTASTSAICTGSTGTVTLTGYTGTIQWQQSTTGSSGWSNVSGGSGGTTASYTTPTLTAGLYYQAVVTNGVCPSATSSSVLVSVNQSNAASSIYGGSWSNGQNDNTTSFGAWSLSYVGGYSGLFIGSSGKIDVSSSAWGLYANTSNTASAVRPLSSPMTVGQTLNFSTANGGVQSGGTVGFNLYNASGNTLMEFYFSGGSTNYTLHDNAGSSTSTFGYTTNGLTYGLTYTSSTGNGTYALSVNNGSTTYNFTGTFLSPSGGQVPSQIRFFNYNAGSGSTYNFYVNSLSLNGPVITTQPSTSTQNVAVGGSPSALSIVASGTGLSYQWFRNTSNSNSGGSSISGATSSSYTPSAASAGTTYYYCVVTGICTSTTSNVSGAVIVTPAPIISSFSASPGSGTSGYVGSTVTITGTNLSGATALTVGGTNVFSNIITNTSTSITFTTISGLSGPVSITNSNGTGTSGSSYTDLGYISIASSDWNTGSTWLGGSVPSAGANATIANAVSVTGSVSNAAATVTLNSGSSLSFSSPGTLTASTVTNNGTLSMTGGTLTIAASGTLTNNTSGTSFSGGTVSFSGAGSVGGTYPITFNNLLSISGVVSLNTQPTINDSLTINTLGGVAVNAPYYGTSSTLFYNASTSTSSPYSRTYEWIAGTTSSSSAGYPHNVTIGSSTVACVLDVNNVVALQMGGTLTIGASSGSSSSLIMNEPGTGTPLPLTVIGNVVVNSTGTMELGYINGSDAGDLYVKGNFTNNGTLTTNSRAVFFSGSSAQAISGSALNASSGSSNNLPYLFITNTSGTVSLGSNVTVSNTLTVNSGATLNDGGNTLTVSGNSIVNNGTHQSASGGEILVAGSGPTISGTGTFQNLEISLLGSSDNATISTSFTVSGNLKVTEGTVVSSGSNTITMSGISQTITVSNGTNGGTITGTDNGYGNNLTLAVASGSTTTFTGNATTSSDNEKKFYSINVSTGGTLALGCGILCKYGTFTVNGTLQINANGYVQSTSGSAASYSSGNLIYNNGGSYTATDKEWPTSNSPTNVTVEAASTNVTLNDNKTIAGTLTLTSSSDKLSINGDTLTLNGSVTGSGTLAGSYKSGLIIGGTAGTINFTSGYDTLKTLTLNSSSSATLGTQLNMTAGSSAGIVTIGSGATLTTGGNLVLKSDINGTARIAQSSGTISGNVTVERYIPSKAARKYSFIASAVGGVTVSNSWQNQIYITGSGSGGSVCSTLNSNGFDVTQTSTPSMFTYAATASGGTHWATIPNTTSTYLSPGTGYKVNIRGDRNSGDVTCANQLETASPTPPEPVTLSASGSVGQGSISVNLNTNTNPSNLYTLLGNPYPCPISFSAFQGDNSASITPNLWLYSTNTTTDGGFLPGNYTTINTGTLVNAPSGYTLSGLNNIESGQSFFVQSVSSSATSVSFGETHKTTGTPVNINFFGTNVTKQIRIGLQTTENSQLDEVVVRFMASGSDTYNSYYDAASFDGGSQVLVAMKGNTRLAIATLPDVSASDSERLGVSSTSTGTFQLVFSQFDGIDSSKSITLVDNYLKTTQDIRASQVYIFNVTSDTGSYGNNRFVILFGASAISNPLPVSFTDISATKNSLGVSVNWSVANQLNIANYAIERSTDGSTFADIANEKATAKTAYSLEDEAIPTTANTLYYRIKSIGYDGSYKYSNTVKLLLSNRNTQLSIFPNPVQNMINVTLGYATNGAYTVRILTVAGKEVISSGSLISNNNKIFLNASNLSAGVYMLELTDAIGNKLLEKFVKN